MISPSIRDAAHYWRAAFVPAIISDVPDASSSAISFASERISDLSGQLIPPGRGAYILIEFVDTAQEDILLDVTDAEAEAFGRKGRRQARRGRRPKSGSE
jgi:hypothetical protein